MTTPTASGNPITISVGLQPIQICPPTGGPVLIYNFDLVNVAYAGYNDAIAQTNSCSIQPLAFAVMDGTRAIWGFCPTSSSVLLNVVPGGTSQSASPAQIAAQISALGLATLDEQINQNTSIPTNISTTGAPLLNLYNLLTEGTANIGLGDSTTLGPFTISQIGYEFIIELGTAQDTNAAEVSINFQWSDSASGLVTAVQTFNAYAAYTGGSGPSHQVEGHGPSNADTLFVYVTATSQPVEVYYALLQTSRVYGRHDWRTQNPSGVAITFPTMTYVSCNPACNILAGQATGNLTENESISYLLPLYVGTGSIWFNTGTQVTGGAALLQDAFNVLSSSTLQRWKSASNGDQSPTPISLPRDQCTIEMLNGTTGTTAMTLGIIAQELETN
jgi:hypothetical protein